MYNACAHTYIVVDPVPCGEISRAAFIGMSWLKYAATFRGRRDFEVRRDFEEIRYSVCAIIVVSTVSGQEGGT